MTIRPRSLRKNNRIRGPISVLLLAALAATLFLTACSDIQANDAAIKHTAEEDYADLSGMSVGVLTGAFYDTIVRDKLNGNPVYYQDDSAALEDVRNGRIDGVMYDYSTALVVGNQPGNEVFEIVAIPEYIYTGPMGAVSASLEVIDSFNAFLAGIEADGTLEDMQRRWIEENPGSDPPMPDIPSTGENGTLRVATTGLSLPFSYVGADSKLKGFCIEMALRFAAHEGKRVEFITVMFEGMIQYVASGKADIGIDATTITLERKQSILVSNPYYHDLVGVLMLKSRASGAHYTDFYQKKLGVLAGMTADIIAEELFSAECVYYQDSSSAIEDIRNNRISGLLYDLSSSRIITELEGNEDLQCVAVPREAASVPLGAVSSNPDIINRFNSFLNAIKKDGTLLDMQDRWLESLTAIDSGMPEIPLANQNGVLRIAVDDAAVPFTYRGADGELRGFCVELAMRFAAYEGVGIEFMPMDFSVLIPYVGSGKADMGIDAITITDERKEIIMFTDAFYENPVGILALRQADAMPVKEKAGFIAWLKTAIERNLITDNRYKMIIDGLKVTMTIAALAQVFGTVLGALVCWLLTRKNNIVRWIGNIYCGLIYGTPIVVLLMITYYILFGSTSISNVFVAVAAFTMVTGAGVAANLKDAIEAVDAVEIEAARSIGFSAFEAFRAVTLPQAVKHALPGYTNGFVELVKATAIVGYIAIQDLTRTGDIIRSRTYDAYFPLLFVAAIYLIVTALCVWVFKFIVKKVNSGGAA